MLKGEESSFELAFGFYRLWVAEGVHSLSVREECYLNPQTCQAQRFSLMNHTTLNTPFGMKLWFMIGAVLLFTLHSHAWSSAGHQVIAAEAYRELSPKYQAKVSEILRSHPEYQKWTNSFQGGSQNLSLELFVFMRASTWPDEIRRKRNPYDHPHWHYVDYPLRPTKFSFEPAPDPHDDILFGISQCEKVLSDKSTSPEERAVYLSWLIHLIGDLHQPLHCSSFFSSDYPKGDKGGNSWFIKPASRGISLHSFWDGLLGTSRSAQTHVNYAAEISEAYPKKTLKLKGSVKDWSLDGRAMAVEKVYLHGELKGSTDKNAAPELPDGYTKEAKEVAEEQAAFAGYRLEMEIEKWVR